MSAVRVLDVGNCDPDHAMISSMLRKNFDVVIDRVMFVHEAMERLKATSYGLVLFNRLVFADSSPGIDLLRQARSDQSLSNVPMMMISNYAESQAESVAAGGVPGFGKAGVNHPKTIETLSQYLPSK